MKIGRIATAALFSLGVLACFPALAQPAGGGGPGGQGGQGGQGQNRPSFETVKADILKNHQARIDAMQQSLTCIQAAKDHEALRTCMRNERKAMEQTRGHREGGRQGGRGGPPADGPGQQGGPQRQ
jgi:hypothetical protein